MYCPQCNCKFTGWNDRCPLCKTVLLEAQPAAANLEPNPTDYASLVDTVRKNGGILTIEMTATSIETKRGRAFLYLGRGYAWTKQFEGSKHNFTASLTTTTVGRDRTWTFPFFGYGFAWEQEMRGNVSNNPLTLKAEKIDRQRKMEFPYRGFGYAWVQAMSGECGDQLKATLMITEVQRRKKWGFPYFGFGFAWPNAGQLTITLVD